ncbi:hypothetical protein ElyMa_005697800 [Elysia marginata]|uniref:Uncharacterized protein n=1 Tax=Elysia marginata TaxID=1093978 RepID=A0AAV4FGF0_9GAST|nr:hypothetical protein ElyMa_005697800 [Elysia marginata]
MRLTCCSSVGSEGTLVGNGLSGNPCKALLEPCTSHISTTEDTSELPTNVCRGGHAVDRPLFNQQVCDSRHDSAARLLACGKDYLQSPIH